MAAPHDTGKRVKVREPWLDYVRMASIFLVILYHTPPRVPLLDDAVVLNLRVPVFFMVSGFLFRGERWPRFLTYLKHRARQILVPYTVFFFLFYALRLAMGNHVNDAGEPVSRWLPLQEWAWGYPREVVGTFWYIACLFSMQVLYYWVERLVPRRWLLATCVTVSMGYMALAWWVDADLYVSYWNLSHAVQYLPFYAMGNCLRDWLARLEFTGWRQATLLGVLSIASVAIMAVSLPEPGDQQWTYGMAKVVAGAMIIPAYVCVCKAVSRHFGRRAVVESIVMGGTIYLAVQNYFIGALRNVMLWLGAGDLTDALWMRPIVALVVMVGIYPLSWLVQHHAKWMIGKGRLFGNP